MWVKSLGFCLHQEHHPHNPPTPIALPSTRHHEAQPGAPAGRAARPRTEFALLGGHAALWMGQGHKLRELHSTAALLL